ncbi:MAG: DNA/RNA nuclease SfsA [Ruminococcus sp.]|nr:DNA/RNA nuclease SfsA [Ruminococcus sp.]
MRYENICRGIFQSRPNRFIAEVLIDGRTEICHVKNTGRCRELLVRGAEVFLVRSNSPGRRTAYDLVAVMKGERLINIDSQAPNKAVMEWLLTERPFGDDMEPYPEKTFGGSRFDFMLKSNKTDRVMYLEVKGCTLEREGVVLFPDAPTERGAKHIRELIRCREEGLAAALLILVQMENVKYFTPNKETDPVFAQALKDAKQKGVQILCFDSICTPESMTVNSPVEVIF